MLGADRGRPGNVYFVTDGDPIVFRDFVTQLLQTQDVEPPNRAVPAAVAGVLASVTEAAWRALPLPGPPPLTRFAYWAASQECTIRIDKARRDLGYSPVTSREAGLTELRSARHDPVTRSPQPPF